TTAPDQHGLIDIAATSLFETLRQRLPGVLQIDLASNRRIVALALQTDHGPITLTFSRKLVTASNPHQLLVIMGAASVLLSLVAFIYLRNQLRPIRLLSRAAEAFGHGETLAYKPSGSIEVRAAGMAFLEMRDRIERQIEQRTLMLSGVSHDLRTPLTRMKLGLSLIDDPEALAMRRDVADMEGLIDEFIAFARGDQQDDVADIDLTDFIAERARHTNGALTIVPPPAGSVIRARPVALGRALDNLISNALRYGKTARLSVALGETWVTFSVEDDGPGIAEADREPALRPFVRLDPARNQDKGTGSGLGLAITNDIARRHGGSVRLGVSADLHGLKAEIILPRQSAGG
ncbi:MAG: ATP-binding protein, partial [Deltaproteobacteria bacterium]